jgi:hypothetical protein
VSGALEAAGHPFSLSKIGSINRDFVFGISVMEAHVIVVA